MADYSISIDAAGSAKDNERDRSISGLFSYTGGTYNTISLLTGAPRWDILDYQGVQSADGWVSGKYSEMCDSAKVFI